MTLLNQMESSMNSKAVVSTLIAMSLIMGGVASAQRDETRQPDRQPNRLQNQDRRDNQARQPNRPGNQGRADNYERRDERGAGPDHQFQRGDRLPLQYRHRNYVVDDWRGHNLSAPPRGYHWVQTGGDYVLVAIATGIILQLMLNN